MDSVRYVIDAKLVQKKFAKSIIFQIILKKTQFWKAMVNPVLWRRQHANICEQK